MRTRNSRVYSDAQLIFDTQLICSHTLIARGFGMVNKKRIFMKLAYRKRWHPFLFAGTQIMPELRSLNRDPPDGVAQGKQAAP